MFNTYVSLDTIKTKYYKARDFSLINITTKDTLFLRSEFKGGDTGLDAYSLNFYHTINAQKQNVVGIQKSELLFNNFLWSLNQVDNDKNKIVFDKKFQNFAIEDIVLSHENQKIQLNGTLFGSKNKDLRLDFTEVQLGEILPKLSRFKIDGALNGVVQLKQIDAVYQPTSSLKIDKLVVNDVALGNMNLNIQGDQSFQKFYIFATRIKSF